jgi:hypothetical protein
MVEPIARHAPLAIVTPVYNDWESLDHLLADLDTQARSSAGWRRSTSGPWNCWS